jgi:CRISPR-associated protein Cmr5
MRDKEPTTRNTLEQGRAQHAFEKAKDAGDKEKFASYAKKLPMMIKTNGLGASMAFANAKNERAWKELFQAIEDWLQKKDYIKNALLEELVKTDSAHYRILTNEVIAYLTWLRRFAEGFKPAKKEKE